MLSLYNAMFWVLGMDHVISESYYNETILQTYSEKMDIIAISYSSFVKTYKKKFGSHGYIKIILNQCYNEVCYKGLHCIP